jgi:DNA-binding IclR family transcriptional regulator
MDIKEIVLDALKKSPAPLKSGEIADMTGQDKAKVDKAIKTLVSEEKVTSPKRCYYQVK